MVLFLIYWGNSTMFSIVIAAIYIPTNNAQGLPFLYLLAKLYYFFSFNCGHSNKCDVVSHCGFDLHFPADKWCWASVHVPGNTCRFHLQKCLFRSSVHFLNPIVLFIFLVLNCINFSYIFEYRPLIRYMFYKYFSTAL